MYATVDFICNGIVVMCSTKTSDNFKTRSKTEVTMDVRNSKVWKHDKFRRDWPRHENTCKSQSGTGPGARRGKCHLLACHTRCKCSMETSHN